MLGGYTEFLHSVMNSFSKIFGYSFTQISLGIKWGTLLAFQEKVCFSKSSFAVTSRNMLVVKSIGLSRGFLVGDQSFGISQMVVAVCQFRRSLAIDLYTVGLAAVGLSLLETLTVFSDAFCGHPPKVHIAKILKYIYLNIVARW